ncbi:alkyl hydroperoxide reductase/ Thiol specific antioxidant/ Mal allergen [Clostridium sp. DL-VIII]|uniref:peroxiredoxin-like family protein n=1 Tax=Clostridium sp. DL-VIII TaxID=641107 RepID=UPI00023AFDF1|nr:peroxiredoxin-like family protein [Clostridium sp. DL-VIII]EHI99004.1 alkyl hydroperoxide reductase/ Thiol specific antioxidant/ Mal allergen [Clostridium sp. DL-VIII]
MNLKSELLKVDENFIKVAPKDIIDLFERQAKKLAHKQIEKDALKVGDKLPDFELQNSIGQKINSYDLLSNGPLVISFYRGGWCPYCNLELRAYQEILPEIKNLGAQLVGISPELPDNSISLTEKYSLKFQILSDIENEVAREFGIVYHVEEELQEAYKNLGIDLVSTQGNNNYELPVPATYVVNTNGNVILSYVNTDYTKRLEPSAVLESLRNLVS